MNKIKTRTQLKIIACQLRQLGKTVVHTNGGFDIVHAGHIKTLRKAKAQGDILIVAVNSDASVKRHKGEDRPIMKQAERAELLAAFEFVDFVTIFPEDHILRTLEIIKPDIHTKGGSFDPTRARDEKALMESWGGRFTTFELLKGHSTTDVITRVLRSSDHK